MAKVWESKLCPILIFLNIFLKFNFFLLLLLLRNHGTLTVDPHSSCLFYFGQFLKATQCAHMLEAACFFGPAPLKSIHCYSSPPSLSLSLIEWYMFWLMIRDTLWGTSAMKTSPMNHQGQKTQKLTGHSSLYIPLYCGPTFLHSLRLGPSTFSVSLCSCEWPGYLKLKDTMMCSDIWQWERRGAGTLLFHCGSLCD